jgi:hypothetical protein
MTYSQTAVKTRYDFETVAQIAATQRRAERKKLARLRTIKRVLHFVGFLSYWAIFAGIAYLVATAVMIAFVCMA